MFDGLPNKMSKIGLQDLSKSVVVQAVDAIILFVIYMFVNIVIIFIIFFG